MKKIFSSSIGLILTASALNGCALLLPKHEEVDPVAQAALGLRPVAAGRAPASEGTDSPEGPEGTASLQRERPAPSFNRLTLGMTMPRVLELWGKPTDVKAAGDSNDGNERWVYSEGVAGLYGLGSNRVVYFEQGRVAGWESH